MMRVYAALKSRIMSNGFVPGERLDPARLARDMMSSATPVRDALYRLTGERLIETWQHEGFRMPLVTETTLRELLTWSRAVMRIAVALAAEGSQSDRPRTPVQASKDVDAVFNAIAIASRSYEVRAAVANLNDRCGTVRTLERPLLKTDLDPDAFAGALQIGNWTALQMLLDQYFDQRMAIIPALAESLRPRSEGYDP